ncbi:DUF6355 family natural product biosynthesis protein [Kibdelosporangium aridum]|nr:DUF6355 family natural product biosynthesis protein [Kibdelosporangium aridum]
MTRKLIVCIGFVMAITAGMTGTAVADPEPRPEQCGFYAGPIDAYYKHCGTNWITIRVRFWYGASIKDIRVGPGITNLSNHPDLQGSGLITNAWCVKDC